MFTYYFKLGVRSLRRNPMLTALMVLTLAVGVAASVSTLTILHMMSSDPIPQKSDRLFVPLIDNGPLEGYTPGEKRNEWEIQISYQDAMNIVKGAPGIRKTALYAIAAPIQPPRADMTPFNASGLVPTRDFFAMMDVPFLYGQTWTEQDDARGADVVVLSRDISEKLYGNTNPVGQRLTLLGLPFTIVGVVDHWMPLPRFYRLAGGTRFGEGEEFFIPLASSIRHEVTHNGSMSCSSNSGAGFAARVAS